MIDITAEQINETVEKTILAIQANVVKEVNKEDTDDFRVLMMSSMVILKREFLENLYHI